MARQPLNPKLLPFGLQAEPRSGRARTADNNVRRHGTGRAGEEHRGLRMHEGRSRPWACQVNFGISQWDWSFLWFQVPSDNTMKTQAIPASPRGQ